MKEENPNSEIERREGRGEVGGRLAKAVNAWLPVVRGAF